MTDIILKTIGFPKYDSEHRSHLIANIGCEHFFTINVFLSLTAI